MKTIVRKGVQLAIGSGLGVMLLSQGAMAESLYEFYMNTPTGTLQSDTQEMSRDLKTKFTEQGIVAKRQEILFSGYLSNLEKAVAYASKMAPYNQYEEDLKYARDHEVFKVLHGEEEARQADETAAAQELRNRKKYAEKKVEQMEKNVLEDIDIYSSMIKMALDDCEDVFYSDLDNKNFFTSDHFSDRIQDFFSSDIYVQYLARQDDFGQRWPDMQARLLRQIELWGPAQVDGKQAIIDPAIVQAL